MSPEQLAMLKDNGPWFLIAFLLIKDLVPFLLEKFFPEVLKERKAESDRRWALNERQVQAQENIAKAMQQMMVLLATVDARTEVVAGGMQRIEVISTEINTRLRGREQDIPTTPLPKPKRMKAEA